MQTGGLEPAPAAPAAELQEIFARLWGEDRTPFRSDAEWRRAAGEVLDVIDVIEAFDGVEEIDPLHLVPS